MVCQVRHLHTWLYTTTSSHCCCSAACCSSALPSPTSGTSLPDRQKHYSILASQNRPKVPALNFRSCWDCWLSVVWCAAYSTTCMRWSSFRKPISCHRSTFYWQSFSQYLWVIMPCDSLPIILSISPSSVVDWIKNSWHPYSSFPTWWASCCCLESSCCHILSFQHFRWLFMRDS